MIIPIVISCKARKICFKVGGTRMRGVVIISLNNAVIKSLLPLKTGASYQLKLKIWDVGVGEKGPKTARVTE